MRFLRCSPGALRALISCVSMAALGAQGCAMVDVSGPPRDAGTDRSLRSDTGVAPRDSSTMMGDCIPGETRDCYTGPDGTDGIGA